LVDTSSVRSRLEHLDELVKELDAIRAGGRDAYMTEWRTRLAAEHRPEPLCTAATGS
jgi:hypothetical protein